MEKEESSLTLYNTLDKKCKKLNKTKKAVNILIAPIGIIGSFYASKALIQGFSLDSQKLSFQDICWAVAITIGVSAIAGGIAYMTNEIVSNRLEVATIERDSIFSKRIK